MPSSAMQTEQSEAGWLSDLFDAFLRVKIPTPQEYANCRLHAEDVVHTLRRALYPIRMAGSMTGDSLVVGGVGKRTALSPIACVDVLYLLPSKLRISRTADALKVVHAGLADQYEAEVIAAADLGVTVTTGDRRIRIIPALEHGTGFKIPGPTTLDRASGWRITNPVSEAATLRLSDSLNTGWTRRLLTILKSWRDHTETPLDSLTLEVLVQEFCATQKRQATLPDAFKAFVAWARSKPVGRITAPGAATTLELDQSWHGSAKAAYWRVTLAEQTASTDRLKAALEWRNLLGMDFPVPEDSDKSVPPILEACA
ncbi:MAG: hypothetical protein HOO09_03235 [Rhodospirillaceae bacterium]|nr:hypothetical protein [Rhodospirillaceae bacterium]